MARKGILEEKRMAYGYKLWRCDYNKSKYTVILDRKTFTVDLENKSCSYCTFRQQMKLPCRHILSVLYLLCDSGSRYRDMFQVPEEQKDVLRYTHHAFKYNELLKLLIGQNFEIPPSEEEGFPPEELVKPPPRYYFNNREGPWQSNVGRKQVRRFRSKGEFGHSGKTAKKKRVEAIPIQPVVSTASASSIHEEIMLQTDSMIEEMSPEMFEEMSPEVLVASQASSSTNQNCLPTYTILDELCKDVMGTKPRKKMPKRMNFDTHCWEKPIELESGSYIIGEDPAIQCGFLPKEVYDKKSIPKSMKSKLREAIRLIITYAISKDAFIQTYRALSRFACEEYPRSSDAIIHAAMDKDSVVSSFIPPADPEKGDLYSYLCEVSEICIELSFLMTLKILLISIILI